MYPDYKYQPMKKEVKEQLKFERDRAKEAARRLKAQQSNPKSSELEGGFCGAKSGKTAWIS